jgi:hypothetical protein
MSHRPWAGVKVGAPSLSPSLSFSSVEDPYP